MVPRTALAAGLAAVALSLAGAFAASAAEQRIVDLAPADMKWVPSPSLPAGAQWVVLQGPPNQPGPYAYRLKYPPRYRVPPHSHSDDRSYTVLSGTLYEADGAKFDESKLKARVAGSFHTYVANTPHFGMTRDEEVVLQVNGFGPTASTYVNPADDPRKK